MPSPLEWLRALEGRFVVFEGPDGSGKSTQYRRLAGACAEAGVRLCEVREPGGTEVGERVREILLDRAHHDMSLTCEMLLYMASRSQLVERRIRPALRDGALVLADRFVSSTLAYQGAGGGLPVGQIRAAAAIATGGLSPDLVVIFDVDEATSAARLNPLLAGRALDRIESRDLEFQRRVRQGYLDQAAADPEHHAVIDASRPPDQVWDSLLAALRAHVATLAPQGGSAR